MSGVFDENKNKFILKKGSFFDTNLLPIIQNLTAQGFTEAEIGAIVGYQGENAGSWIAGIMKSNPEVKDAIKIGRKIADANLVANMYKSAIGYEYEETEEIVSGDKITIKKKHKHQPGNSTMQMFLAVNHMPEQYKNRVETTKKGFVLNTNVEISGEQIEKLAGKLLDTAKQVKQVESKVIDNEVS